MCRHRRRQGVRPRGGAFCPIRATRRAGIPYRALMRLSALSLKSAPTPLLSVWASARLLPRVPARGSVRCGVPSVVLRIAAVHAVCPAAVVLKTGVAESFSYEKKRFSYVSGRFSYVYFRFSYENLLFSYDFLFLSYVFFPFSYEKLFWTAVFRNPSRALLEHGRAGISVSRAGHRPGASRAERPQARGRATIGAGGPLGSPCANRK